MAPSSVLGTKIFADHLNIVGTATGLPLKRIFTTEPRCDLRECERCDRKLIICDDGNNVYTINFLLETLAMKCKLGDDFCIGIHEVESQVRWPFRVCLARSALRHMLQVHRLGEIVNRCNSGFLTALRRRPTGARIDHSKILARGRRAANRVIADIQGGLGRITPRVPSAGSQKVSPKSIGRVRLLSFHGHQLRQAARGRIDWYVHPKPDIVAFAHYHRLWAFEFRGMVCVIGGCWMLTFPKYEIVLFPSIGLPFFEISRMTKAFRITLMRYGAGAPDVY